MKLGLKHLAAYLPYNLQLLFEKSGRITAMIGCYQSDNLHIIDYNDGSDYNLTIWNFKPILHPLSDLTKEIEVNGEIFIPIDKIKAELLGVDWLVFGESKYGWTGFIDQSNNSQANHIPIYMKNEIMDECSYLFYQKLCEWHFDLFGLIDAGLAVNINNVKL